MAPALSKRVGLTALALVGPPAVWVPAAVFLPWSWLGPTFIPWPFLFLLAVVVGGCAALIRAWPRWDVLLAFIYVPVMLLLLFFLALYVGLLMGGEPI